MRDFYDFIILIVQQYGGINVDIQISEGGVYISLSAYSPGNAPALIINQTPHTIDFWEKGSLNVRYRRLKRGEKKLILLLTGYCNETYFIQIYTVVQ